MHERLPDYSIDNPDELTDFSARVYFCDESKKLYLDLVTLMNTRKDNLGKAKWLIARLAFYTSVAFLTFILHGCSSGCGGFETETPYVMRYLKPIDTTARITYFAYKDKPGTSLNSSTVRWDLSISRTFTEMYIHTTAGVDTLTVRSDKTMKYYENECGDEIYTRVSYAIVSHTFDTIYTIPDNNRGNMDYEYTCFK